VTESLTSRAGTRLNDRHWRFRVIHESTELTADERERLSPGWCAAPQLEPSSRLLSEFMASSILTPVVKELARARRQVVRRLTSPPTLRTGPRRLLTPPRTAVFANRERVVTDIASHPALPPRTVDVLTRCSDARSEAYLRARVESRSAPRLTDGPTCTKLDRLVPSHLAEERHALRSLPDEGLEP
jgi:hypothetical protein